MSKIIMGIDEAGRGPVIGPMVVCGAMFKEEDIKKLKALDVKDSKLLSKKRREELFSEIKKIAVDYKIIKISPKEIDQRFQVNTNLNQLEALKFVDIINSLKPDVAIIDTPERNTNKFKAYLKRYLTHDCELVCENFADTNHIEVGAASVLAKVTRDSSIRKIEEDIGETIGAGYPSDPTTIRFVEKAMNQKELLKYVRKSWFTFQRLKEESEQTKLSKWKSK